MCIRDSVVRGVEHQRVRLGHFEVLTINPAHFAEAAALLILGEQRGQRLVLERAYLNRQLLFAGSGLKQLRKLLLVFLALLLFLLGLLLRKRCV